MIDLWNRLSAFVLKKTIGKIHGFEDILAKTRLYPRHREGNKYIHNTTRIFSELMSSIISSQIIEFIN